MWTTPRQSWLCCCIYAWLPQPSAAALFERPWDGTIEQKEAWDTLYKPWEIQQIFYTWPRASSRDDLAKFSTANAPLYPLSAGECKAVADAMKYSFQLFAAECTNTYSFLPNSEDGWYDIGLCYSVIRPSSHHQVNNNPTWGMVDPGSIFYTPCHTRQTAELLMPGRHNASLAYFFRQAAAPLGYRSTGEQRRPSIMDQGNGQRYTGFQSLNQVKEFNMFRNRLHAHEVCPARLLIASQYTNSTTQTKVSYPAENSYTNDLPAGAWGRQEALHYNVYGGNTSKDRGRIHNNDEKFLYTRQPRFMVVTSGWCSGGRDKPAYVPDYTFCEWAAHSLEVIKHTGTYNKNDGTPSKWAISRPLDDVTYQFWTGTFQEQTGRKKPPCTIVKERSRLYFNPYYSDGTARSSTDTALRQQMNKLQAAFAPGGWTESPGGYSNYFDECSEAVPCICFAPPPEHEATNFPGEGVAFSIKMDGLDLAAVKADTTKVQKLREVLYAAIMLGPYQSQRGDGSSVSAGIYQNGYWKDGFWSCGSDRTCESTTWFFVYQDKLLQSGTDQSRGQLNLGNSGTWGTFVSASGQDYTAIVNDNRKSIDLRETMFVDIIPEVNLVTVILSPDSKAKKEYLEEIFSGKFVDNTNKLSPPPPPPCFANITGICTADRDCCGSDVMCVNQRCAAATCVVTVIQTKHRTCKTHGFPGMVQDTPLDIGHNATNVSQDYDYRAIDFPLVPGQVQKRWPIDQASFTTAIYGTEASKYASMFPASTRIESRDFMERHLHVRGTNCNAEVFSGDGQQSSSHGWFREGAHWCVLDEQMGDTRRRRGTSNSGGNQRWTAIEVDNRPVNNRIRRTIPYPDRAFLPDPPDVEPCFASFYLQSLCSNGPVLHTFGLAGSKTLREGQYLDYPTVGSRYYGFRVWGKDCLLYAYATNPPRGVPDPLATGGRPDSIVGQAERAKTWVFPQGVYACYNLTSEWFRARGLPTIRSFRVGKKATAYYSQDYYSATTTNWLTDMVLKNVNNETTTTSGLLIGSKTSGQFRVAIQEVARNSRSVHIGTSMKGTKCVSFGNATTTPPMKCVLGPYSSSFTLTRGVNGEVCVHHTPSPSLANGTNQSNIAQDYSGLEGWEVPLEISCLLPVCMVPEQLRQSFADSLDNSTSKSNECPFSFGGQCNEACWSTNPSPYCDSELPDNLACPIGCRKNSDCWDCGSCRCQINEIWDEVLQSCIATPANMVENDKCASAYNNLCEDPMHTAIFGNVRCRPGTDASDCHCADPSPAPNHPNRPQAGNWDPSVRQCVSNNLCMKAFNQVCEEHGPIIDDLNSSSICKQAYFDWVTKQLVPNDTRTTDDNCKCKNGYDCFDCGSCRCGINEVGAFMRWDDATQACVAFGNTRKTDLCPLAFDGVCQDPMYVNMLKAVPACNPGSDASDCECNGVLWDEAYQRCAGFTSAPGAWLYAGQVTSIGTHPEWGLCANHPQCQQELDNLRNNFPGWGEQVVAGIEAAGCCPMRLDITPENVVSQVGRLKDWEKMMYAGLLRYWRDPTRFAGMCQDTQGDMGINNECNFANDNVCNENPAITKDYLLQGSCTSTLVGSCTFGNGTSLNRGWDECVPKSDCVDCGNCPRPLLDSTGAQTCIPTAVLSCCNIQPLGGSTQLVQDSIVIYCAVAPYILSYTAFVMAIYNKGWKDGKYTRFLCIPFIPWFLCELCRKKKRNQHRSSRSKRLCTFFGCCCCAPAAYIFQIMWPFKRRRKDGFEYPQWDDSIVYDVRQAMNLNSAHGDETSASVLKELRRDATGKPVLDLASVGVPVERMKLGMGKHWQDFKKSTEQLIPWAYAVCLAGTILMATQHGTMRSEVMFTPVGGELPTAAPASAASAASAAESAASEEKAGIFRRLQFEVGSSTPSPSEAQAPSPSEATAPAEAQIAAAMAAAEEQGISEEQQAALLAAANSGEEPSEEQQEQLQAIAAAYSDAGKSASLAPIEQGRATPSYLLGYRQNNRDVGFIEFWRLFLGQQHADEVADLKKWGLEVVRITQFGLLVIYILALIRSAYRKQSSDWNMKFLRITAAGAILSFSFLVTPMSLFAAFVVLIVLVITVPILALVLRGSWMSTLVNAFIVAQPTNLGGQAAKSILKEIGNFILMSFLNFGRFLLDLIVVRQSMMGMALCLNLPPEFKMQLMSLPFALKVALPQVIAMPGLKELFQLFLWLLTTLVLQVQNLFSPTASCYFMSPFMTLIAVVVLQGLTFLVVCSDLFACISISALSADKLNRKISHKAILVLRSVCFTVLQVAATWSASGIALGVQKLSLSMVEKEKQLIDLRTCSIPTRSIGTDFIFEVVSLFTSGGHAVDPKYFITLALTFAAFAAFVQSIFTLNGNILAQAWALKFLERVLGLPARPPRVAETVISKRVFMALFNPMAAADPQLAQNDKTVFLQGSWTNIGTNATVRAGMELLFVNEIDVEKLAASLPEDSDEGSLLVLVKKAAEQEHGLITIRAREKQLGTLAQVDPNNSGLRNGYFKTTLLLNRSPDDDFRAGFQVGKKEVYLDLGHKRGCPWFLAYCDQVVPHTRALEVVRKAKAEWDGLEDEKPITEADKKKVTENLNAGLRDLLYGHQKTCIDKFKSIPDKYLLAIVTARKWKAKKYLQAVICCVLAFFFLIPGLATDLKQLLLFTLLFLYLGIIDARIYSSKLAGFSKVERRLFLVELEKALLLVVKPLPGGSDKAMAKKGGLGTLNWMQQTVQSGLEDSTAQMALTFKSAQLPSWSLQLTALGIWSPHYNELGYLIRERAERYAKALNRGGDMDFIRDIAKALKLAVVQMLSVTFLVIPGGAIIGKCMEYVNNPSIFFLDTYDKDVKNLKINPKSRKPPRVVKLERPDLLSLSYCMRTRFQADGTRIGVFANGPIGTPKDAKNEVETGMRLVKITKGSEEVTPVPGSVEQVQSLLAVSGSLDLHFVYEPRFGISKKVTQLLAYVLNLLKILMIGLMVLGADPGSLPTFLGIGLMLCFPVPAIKAIWNIKDIWGAYTLGSLGSLKLPQIEDFNLVLPMEGFDALKLSLCECTSLKAAAAILQRALAQLGIPMHLARRMLMRIGDQHFFLLKDILIGKALFADVAALLDLLGTRDLLMPTLLKLGFPMSAAEDLVELMVQKMRELAKDVHSAAFSLQSDAMRLVNAMLRGDFLMNTPDAVFEICGAFDIGVDKVAKALIDAQVRAMAAASDAMDEVLSNMPTVNMPEDMKGRVQLIVKQVLATGQMSISALASLMSGLGMDGIWDSIKFLKQGMVLCLQQACIPWEVAVKLADPLHAPDICALVKAPLMAAFNQGGLLHEDLDTLITMLKKDLVTDLLMPSISQIFKDLGLAPKNVGLRGAAMDWISGNCGLDADMVNKIKEGKDQFWAFWGRLMEEGSLNGPVFEKLAEMLGVSVPESIPKLYTNLLGSLGIEKTDKIAASEAKLLEEKNQQQGKDIVYGMGFGKDCKPTVIGLSRLAHLTELNLHSDILQPTVMSWLEKAGAADAVVKDVAAHITPEMPVGAGHMVTELIENKGDVKWDTDSLRAALNLLGEDDELDECHLDDDESYVKFKVLMDRRLGQPLGITFQDRTDGLFIETVEAPPALPESKSRLGSIKAQAAAAAKEKMANNEAMKAAKARMKSSSSSIKEELPLVTLWNKKNPENDVRVGDRIMKINGVTGERAELEEEVQRHAVLSMIIVSQREKKAVALPLNPFSKSGASTIWGNFRKSGTKKNAVGPAPSDPNVPPGEPSEAWAGKDEAGSADAAGSVGDKIPIGDSTEARPDTSGTTSTLQ